MHKAVTALRTLIFTWRNSDAKDAPIGKGDELEHWKRLLLHIAMIQNSEVAPNILNNQANFIETALSPAIVWNVLITIVKLNTNMLSLGLMG